MNSQRYITEKIFHQNAFSELFTAKDAETGRPVLLEKLKADLRKLATEKRLKFQKTIKQLKEIHDQSIIHVLDYDLHDDQQIIIHEDTAGSLLVDYIEQQPNRPVAQLVRVLLGIIDAGLVLHKNNIHHYALNDRCIHISDKVDIPVIQLRGSGLCYLFDIYNLEKNLANFYFMAPEQFGVLKKALDNRTDIYSLGVIAYWLFCRQYPYIGANSSEVIHHHIASSAKPIYEINKDIPVILSDIVMKALAKEPEDRYQTFAGMKHDLEKFLSEYTTAPESNITFTLGLNDRMQALSYHTRLIGRDKELNVLVTGLDSAVSSKGSIVTIEGEAGLGKSRLIEELRGPVQSLGGSLLTAKYFENEAPSSYKIFLKIISNYVQNLLTLPPEQKQSRATRISAALGDMDGVLVRLIPELRDLLPVIHPYIEIDPDREKMRLIKLIIDFFCQIATADEPLVLVLDDMQWSEDASFELLYQFSLRIQTSNVMVITCYRDNEISLTHPLNVVLERISRTQILTRIKLAFLSPDQVVSLLGDLLRLSPQEVAQLGYVVAAKTKGNPFFVQEFIRTLTHENIIFLDKTNYKWNYDVKRLSDVEFSYSIVEIILKRANQLNLKEQMILETASIVGKEFTFDLLADLINLEKEELLENIDSLIHEFFISREDDDLIFVHDRIRSAFYSRISPERARKIHHQIAVLLEKDYRDGDDHGLIDIAFHYSHSDDKDKAFDYCRAAGSVAKKMFSHREAVQLYEQAMSYIPAGAMLHRTVPVIEIKESLGEACKLAGQYDKALQIINECLQLSDDQLRKINLNRILSEIYFAKSDFPNAEGHAEQGLRLAGHKIPGSFGAFVAGLLWEIFFYNMYQSTHSEKNKKELDLINDKIAFFTVLLLRSIATINIYLSKEKYLYYSLRLLNYAIQFKESNILALCQAMISVAQVSVGFSKKGLEFNRRALELSSKWDDKLIRSKVLWLAAYNYMSTNATTKALAATEEHILLATQIGDIWELCSANQRAIIANLLIGNFRKCFELGNQIYQLAESVDSIQPMAWGLIFSGVAGFVIGEDSEESLKKAERGLALLQKTTEELTISFMFSLVANIYIKAQRYEDAISAIELAIKNVKKARTMTALHGFVFCSVLTVYSAVYEITGNKEYPVIARKFLRKNLSAGKKFTTHYGPSLSAAGDLFYMLGQKEKAYQYWNNALSFMEKNTLNKLQIGSTIFTMTLHAKKDNRPEWQEYGHKAYQIFKETGAIWDMYMTADLLELESKQDSVPEADGTQSSTDYTLEAFVKKRELRTVIEVSQQISSLMELDILLQKIMDYAIEVTGATSGYLFMHDKKSQKIGIKLARNSEKKDISSLNYRYSSNIVGQLDKTKKGIVVSDALSDDRYIAAKEVSNYKLRSVLAAPLITKDEYVGILYLDNNHAAGVFNDDLLNLLGVFCAQAAISIINARAATELKRVYAELERHAETLEIKVKERTHELQEAYEQIKQQEALLIQQEKLASVGDIVAGVAHEINTPLLAATMGLNSLKESIKEQVPIANQGELEMTTNVLTDSLEKIRTHIANLKAFIKFQETPETTFDVNQEIQTTLNILSFKLPSHISLNINFGSNLPSAMGNPAQMNQVFMNLLMNAIEAIPRTQKGIIDIKTSVQQDKVIVEIADNGIGMDQAHLDKLFKERFSTKKNNNMGIGLFLCNELIQRNNATVTVSSTPGQVTRFTLYLKSS